MSAPYLFRLVCLCLSSFFLVHTFLALLVNFASKRAIHWAGRLRAKRAASILFALRLIPGTTACLAVLGFCIPSYIWLEPRKAPEGVGLACIGLAILGAAVCADSTSRLAASIRKSIRFGRACEVEGRKTRLPVGGAPICVVPQDAPILAVVGILRPKLVVSTSVLRALPPDEWHAALRHERAHRIWRDNLKRLALIASPRAIPILGGLSLIENEWARFTEWAADDLAAEGDPHRAISLAAALVRVARLGAAAPHPAIVSSLADSTDLSERVERLLRMASTENMQSRGMLSWVQRAALLIGTALTASLLWPASLLAVHQLLERLIG
jgi:hypothetical protein